MKVDWYVIDRRTDTMLTRIVTEGRPPVLDQFETWLHPYLAVTRTPTPGQVGRYKDYNR